MGRQADSRLADRDWQMDAKERQVDIAIYSDT